MKVKEVQNRGTLFIIFWFQLPCSLVEENKNKNLGLGKCCFPVRKTLKKKNASHQNEFAHTSKYLSI